MARTTSSLDRQRTPASGTVAFVQFCMLQGTCSNRPSESGHVPPPVASVITSLPRAIEPPPHILEHVDHSLQSDSSHSRSHASRLQPSVSPVSSQAWPPCAGSTLGLRMRCLTPPPHAALHALHSLQESSSQSTGQGCSAHLRSSSSGGHPTPPLLGGETVCLRSTWVPPPQVAEQASGTQSVTAQSWKAPSPPDILSTSTRTARRLHSSLSKLSTLAWQASVVFSRSLWRSATWRLFMRASPSFRFKSFVPSASATLPSRCWAWKVAICAPKERAAASQSAWFRPSSSFRSSHLSMRPACTFKNSAFMVPQSALRALVQLDVFRPSRELPAVVRPRRSRRLCLVVSSSAVARSPSVLAAFALWNAC
mmetsp:Transcript_25099/g.65571  ORF Transcript_25099/g.65571 Transcript_25099/m.65571 type:complete len:367 (+) Transcript_25099:712-1812(+)